MLKKSIKYIVIALINWLLLVFILQISTDKFDIRFEESYLEDGIAVITIITFLSLLAVRFFVFVFRKKALQKLTKINIAVAITLLISSFLYVHLIIKIKNDIIINSDFRNQVAVKVKKSDGVSGTKATDLTLKEYQEIKTKIKWLPKLPTEATSIDYSYSEYDDFLPDYTFSLDYSLPKDMEVKTINYKDDIFTKTQSFVLIKNKKRVEYLEIRT